MKLLSVFQWMQAVMKAVKRSTSLRALIFITGWILPAVYGQSGSVYAHQATRDHHLFISQKSGSGPLTINNFNEVNYFEEDETDEDTDHGLGLCETTPIRFKNILLFYAQNIYSDGCVDAPFSEPVPLVILHHSWKFYLS